MREGTPNTHVVESHACCLRSQAGRGIRMHPRAHTILRGCAHWNASASTLFYSICEIAHRLAHTILRGCAHWNAPASTHYSAPNPSTLLVGMLATRFQRGAMLDTDGMLPLVIRTQQSTSLVG